MMRSIVLFLVCAVLIMGGVLQVSPAQSNGFQPVPGQIWHDFFCVGDEVCAIGDINGDGRDDIVTFVQGGKVWVATSTGNHFNDSTVWKETFCLVGDICLVADFDGDGAADIATIATPASGRSGIRVALSNRSGQFGDERDWHADLVCQTDAICTADDVDGDGDTDLVIFQRDSVEGQSGKVLVSLSNGGGFETSSEWHHFFCIAEEVCRTGDVNGDGRADILTFVRGNTGNVWVALSLPSGGFGDSTIWHTSFCVGNEICVVGDMNGDGRDDILSFHRESLRDIGQGDPAGQVAGALSTGPPFPNSFLGNAIRHPFFCVGEETCMVGDFNGDGSIDLITFVGDRLSDSRRGDVLVALANFGSSRTWVINFDQLKIARAEESGDDPYIIAIGFRSRFSSRDSTEIFWGRSLRELGSDRATGSVLNIPEAMGRVTFNDVSLWMPNDFLTSSRAFPEIIGVLVIGMESDACSWDAIGRATDFVTGRLETTLISTIERQLPPPLGPGFSNTPDGSFNLDFQEAIELLLNGFDDDIFGTLLAITDLVSCGLDPEDVIGYHLFVFPAVDPGLGNLWTAPTLPNVTIMALQNYAYTIEYNPVVIRGGLPTYSNAGNAEYHLSMTIE